MGEEIEIGLEPEVFFKIESGKDLGHFLADFEWKSFVNGGYIIRAKFSDPYLTMLRKLMSENQDFLGNARKKETKIKFQIYWKDIAKKTPKRLAFITDIDIIGNAAFSGFEIIAVDPPSWYLNAGNGSGKVYEGRVSDVIKEVIKEYTKGGIKATVTKTEDNPKGIWPMMRQDPKTFIRSLLDWSCSFTKKRTNWLITSKDDEIVIQEQFDMRQHAESFGTLDANFGSKPNDILKFNLVSNVFMSTIQNRLTTQGLSSVSGKYLDKETDKDKVEVRDDNTGNKINAKIDKRLGYTKSDKNWSTSIMAIPEPTGGELGKTYDEFVDGRARNIYMNMLPMVMRMMVTINGDYRFNDSSKLGVSSIKLSWKDEEDKDYFLSGKWLVYGFHHRIITTLASKNSKPKWETDLYLYRIDHDANAKPAK